MFTAEEIADEVGLGTIDSESLIKRALERRGFFIGRANEAKTKSMVEEVQEILLGRLIEKNSKGPKTISGGFQERYDPRYGRAEDGYMPPDRRD